MSGKKALGCALAVFVCLFVLPILMIFLIATFGEKLPEDSGRKKLGTVITTKSPERPADTE